MYIVPRGIEPLFKDWESFVLTVRRRDQATGIEGFEPPKAEPESAVLPLHYIPKHTSGKYTN